MPQFSQIEDFLARPENDEILESYREAIAEFNDQIIANKNEFDSFDQILVSLQSYLFARDEGLRSKKRLTKLVLYYMYWICDLGEDKDGAETQKA